MAEDASLCVYLLMRLKNINFVKFFNIMNCDIDCIKVEQFFCAEKRESIFYHTHFLN